MSIEPSSAHQSLLNTVYSECREHLVPCISPENADFLVRTFEAHGVKDLLEVGTAHGYSTLRFAEMVARKNGTVTTIEFSKPSFEMANEYFTESEHHQRIFSNFGNALDFLPTLRPATYDGVFIDAEKRATRDFFIACIPLLKKNGIIIVDDAIKFRWKMESFYEYLESQKIPYEVVRTDEDDGVVVVRF